MNYSKMYSSSQRASCTLSPPASSYQAQPPLGGDEGWLRKSETRPGNSERSRPNYYWLLAVRLRALRGCGRARKHAGRAHDFPHHGSVEEATFAPTLEGRPLQSQTRRVKLN